MNSSVTLTEMLKFSNAPGLALAVTNFRMSGCVIESMPMFAPRRVAPCWMARVASENTRQKLISPDVVPPDEAM